MNKAIEAVKKFVRAAFAFVASDRPVRDAVLAAIAAAVALAAGGDATTQKVAFVAAAYGVGRAVVGALATFVSGKIG